MLYLSVQSRDGEAIFSWQGPHVAGRVHIEGNTWTIEGCGDQCFLWIKHSNTLKYHINSFIATQQTVQYYYQSQGEQDISTMVDFTVMVWYTPQFRGTFSSLEDMMVFIDLIFAETNQGFINSNIPV